MNIQLLIPLHQLSSMYSSCTDNMINYVSKNRLCILYPPVCTCSQANICGFSGYIHIIIAVVMYSYSTFLHLSNLITTHLPILTPTIGSYRDRRREIRCCNSRRLVWHTFLLTM